MWETIKHFIISNFNNAVILLNINENDFISGRATLKKEVSEVIAALKSL